MFSFSSLAFIFKTSSLFAASLKLHIYICKDYNYDISVAECEAIKFKAGEGDVKYELNEVWTFIATFHEIYHSQYRYLHH